MFFGKNKEDIYRHDIGNILENTKTLKYDMIFYSLIIGIISGLIIVVYRILGEKLLEKVLEFYGASKGNIVNIIIVFLSLILAALFVAFCVKREMNISGSGIPQVEGIISRNLKVNWFKILFYKFIGGIVTLAAGLSVGREGPSIQMGASIGQGVAEKAKKMEYEEKYLITSGASAGLSAAFNAPISGIMFALEEVHKNFSPIVLFSAMISAISADVVSKSILGINPALRFSKLSIMPIKYYWALIILGILVGCSSYIFNNGLLFTKKLYKKIPIKIEFKIMFPFILSGIIGMSFPYMIGGGHSIITELHMMDFTVLTVLMLLIIKYLFTFISFGSGVPGGIFFPLLALGSMVGNVFGMICIRYFGIPQEFLINFSILAMAGHFAGIVKAPITGIILIFEMTGSFQQLLPLAVVVFSSMITADLLKVEPVYDMLLEDLLENRENRCSVGDINKKTLLEYMVHLESKVQGKLICQIQWPEDCLLVAIYRGNDEIIPKGKTKVLHGDRLLIMVDQIGLSQKIEDLNDLIMKY